LLIAKSYLQGAHHQSKKLPAIDIEDDPRDSVLWRPHREIQWPPSNSDVVQEPPNARIPIHKHDVFTEMARSGEAWVDGASEGSMVWYWDLRTRKLAEAKAGGAGDSQREKLQEKIDAWAERRDFEETGRR
jgi:hypothetical protein